ncbi:MAG: AAA domain-containing protein, partial [Bacteroidia bacterium]|nr:AAA domain-containing protein [Bacteroidia bacterium]
VKVIRVGHPSRINASIHRSLLSTQIQHHEEYKHLKNMLKEAANVRKKALSFKRNFGTSEREQRQQLLQEAKNLKKEAQAIEKYIQHTLLQNAQVICATLIGCYHPDIANRTYSTAIIDEATQAIEPATWIPITQAKRVILAGDHHQLPPTVKSLKAAKMGLQTTLFEKIYAAYPRCSSLLQAQYRMHPQISEFSNRQFYQNQLQNAPYTMHHSLIHEVSTNYRLREKNIVFIDTAGCGFEEILEEQTKSLYNPQEAE